ncbi:MAG: HlyD family efflux transporter periplasmic adaptor subunit [Porphyromonadaceae bacterium]|nr:HlyD family efflux transporter periplasmic adaptor subunit [Porphyromonadaceae bacterium]
MNQTNFNCRYKIPALRVWGAFLLLIFLLTSCNSNGTDTFASGYFEAVETIVSAQANGQILSLIVEEGQMLSAGDKIGQIDSTQIYLSLLQVRSQRGAVLSRKPDISSQTASLKEQIITAKRELQRVQNLASGNAATKKQVDDAQAQVAVLEKQLKAVENQLSSSSQSISKESNPLIYQAEMLEDQLRKTKIINPVNGTVLIKYAEVNEMAGIGKPLYKIADLSEMILRVYITNSQLSSIQLGQKVKVFVDKTANEQAEYEGMVEWISDKAEFTPKTIQTKDERSNQVYAVKIRVPNDGMLKIGMYGEVAPGSGNR